MPDASLKGNWKKVAPAISNDPTFLQNDILFCNASTVDASTVVVPIQKHISAVEIIRQYKDTTEDRQKRNGWKQESSLMQRKGLEKDCKTATGCTEGTEAKINSKGKKKSND